ncbi:TIGR02391 family protein [Streptomyces sp. 6N223]|uniref:TIGR02391 family protein n=1 Tax=Streptomyces sp. 6N223 TaxID=3457412 RepID=UPI003FCFC9C7
MSPILLASVPGGAGGSLVGTVVKGAFGTFKNPASHRRVDYADPTEAAEVVLLADLLMRLLDKVEASQRAAKQI